jgi:hypothetical protein
MMTLEEAVRFILTQFEKEGYADTDWWSEPNDFVKRMTEALRKDGLDKHEPVMRRALEDILLEIDKGEPYMQRAFLIKYIAVQALEKTGALVPGTKNWLLKIKKENNKGGHKV